MLPKQSRLKKTKDFALMATKGRSVFGLFATLRVRLDASASTAKGGTVGLQPSKIGFIISTKIFKRAVKRNLAKRRFRSALHELLPQIPPGYHLLFILKPETLTADYQAMKDEVLHMLSKIPETMKKPLKLSPRARKEMGKGKVAVGARFVKPKANN
ncbi:MAG: ribonuclease P protein component [Patescibacteria group bacterium]|nr:ribonuclease P protein component [Patescibacteria group bacterium]